LTHVASKKKNEQDKAQQTSNRHLSSHTIVDSIFIVRLV